MSSFPIRSFDIELLVPVLASAEQANKRITVSSGRHAWVEKQPFLQLGLRSTAILHHFVQLAVSFEVEILGKFARLLCVIDSVQMNAILDFADREGLLGRRHAEVVIEVVEEMFLVEDEQNAL